MSTGPIWLDQVSCLGNETSLDKCMHFEWSESNCNHTEDVSVRCSFGKFNLFKKSTKTVLKTFSLDFLGSDGKSSRFLADDDSLQRLTNTETHQYLRDLQRNSKSIPDYSNICGQVKVSDADDSEEKFDRFRVISGSRTKRGYHPWQATSK